MYLKPDYNTFTVLPWRNPKPVFGINGSGMHTNQSLFNADGTNAFFDPNGPLQLSEIAYKYIAGISKNAAVTNPLVAGQLLQAAGARLRGPGLCCLVCVQPFSHDPYSGLARSRHTDTEVRCPDPACNPYLAFAMMLNSGLDGIKNNLQAPPPVNHDIFEMTAEEKKACRAA